MFYHQRLDVPETPAALSEEYLRELADLVDRVGRDRSESETSLDADAIETVEAGEDPGLSLEAAAELAALASDEPDAETIVLEACEHLLLGMSTAVLDVETLAGEVALDLDPKEIQQKVERRAPMTFAEYVHFQHAIAERAP